VALLRTDVSEERSSSIANVVPSTPILVTLIMEALRPSETSVLTCHTAQHPGRRHSS
jgi:hypothetical protein